MTAAIAAVEAVAAVAAVPATATAAAIPAVAAVVAAAAIPATGKELEAEKVAAALAITAKANAPAPGAVDETITGTPAEKPEGVPDKFWDAEKGEVNYVEWNKAHTALETQFHGPEKSPEVIAAEKVIAEAKAAEAGTPASGNAIVDARAEYAMEGKLSDATFTALAAAGLDRKTVEGYLVGVDAQSGVLESAAHDAAEGSENYQKMLEWAADTSNVPVADVHAFNALVASGDTEVIKGAVTDMYGKYRENVTVEGERLGGSGIVSGSATFASKAEMTAAMNAPNPNIPGKTRYQTDPAYRVECQDKIKASRKAGIEIFA